MLQLRSIVPRLSTSIDTAGSVPAPAACRLGRSLPLRSAIVWAGVVLAGGFVGRPMAQEATAPPVATEERLRRLEGKVDSLRQANDQLRRDLGVEGKSGLVVVKPGGKEPTLLLGGLLQVQADFRDQGDNRFASRDRFYLRRARLNATGRFLEGYDFRVEIELSGSLGEASNLRAQVTDGYVNWNQYLVANIRLGQFKTPFGFEQLYADPRLYTIERSLANDRLTLGRQIGGQVSGDLLAKRLSYSAGLFNGTGVNITLNDNDNFLAAGRLAGVPYQGRWGGHGVQWAVGGCAYMTQDLNLPNLPGDFGLDSTPGGSADNVFSGKRAGASFDSQLRIGPLDMCFEYLRVQFEPEDHVPVQRLEADGGYAQAACFVVPQRLQVVAKFDRFEPGRRIASNATQTWTLGLNYTIKGDDLKLQLDGLAVDREAVADTQYKILARAQTVF